jgi:hypothetical protein
MPVYATIDGVRGGIGVALAMAIAGTRKRSIARPILCGRSIGLSVRPAALFH